MKPLGLRRSPTGGLEANDFADPYLELVHLLTQAAGLEHSLMAAYLYAGFSLKPEYASVRGDLTADLFGLHRLDSQDDDDLDKPHNILDVAVEEMQHLGTVNGFLGVLGAAPVMTPHTFPFSADIYPFAIDLRSLTQPVAATFLWVEAESIKLTGDAPGSESPAFQRLVQDALDRLRDPVDREPVSHLGSLYNAIVRIAERVADRPPSFIDSMADWPGWLSKMDWILGQGEIAHYLFFRRIFTGEAFLPGVPDPERVWQDPDSDVYPSRDLARGSAWLHARPGIDDENARRLAWLGDLHYWLILGLLDSSYRGRDRTGRYQAVGQMTRALWFIGTELADTYCVGFPFDPLRPSYEFGKTSAMAVQGILRLANEAVTVETDLGGRGLLPPGYEPDALSSLIAELEGGGG
jgi:hypothetical protein